MHLRCVWVGMPCTCLEVRKELLGVGPPLPPLCGFQGLNSECQACLASTFTSSAILRAPENWSYWSQVWWLTSVIPVLEKLRKENCCQFETRLSYDWDPFSSLFLSSPNEDMSYFSGLQWVRVLSIAGCFGYGHIMTKIPSFLKFQRPFLLCWLLQIHSVTLLLLPLRPYGLVLLHSVAVFSGLSQEGKEMGGWGLTRRGPSLVHGCLVLLLLGPWQ